MLLLRSLSTQYRRTLSAIVLSDLSSNFDGPSNVTSLHVNFDGPSALRVNRPLNVYKYEICKTKKKKKKKKNKKKKNTNKPKTKNPRLTIQDRLSDFACLLN